MQKQQKQRQLDFDVARGVAIILVVFGHAYIGAMNVHGDPPVTRFVVLLLYTFHMALFFLISGALAPASGKPDIGRLSRRLSLRIVYPYILWTIILWLSHYLANDYTNNRAAMIGVKDFLWAPVDVMWFLYVLFFITIALTFMSPVDRRIKLAIGVVLFVTAHLIPPPLIVQHLLRFGGIALIGSSLDSAALLRFASRPWVMAAAVTLFAAGSVIAWLKAVEGPIPGYPSFDLIYIPCTIGGVLLMLGLSRRVLGGDGVEAKNPLASFLVYIGQRTMPIFLAHLLFTAGARIALAQVGLTDFSLIVIAGTLFGVALPLIAYEIGEKMRLGTVLGWK
jgi:fucose 4-O-acetylase-like acetyltransferase